MENREGSGLWVLFLKGKQGESSDYLIRNNQISTYGANMEEKVGEYQNIVVGEEERLPLKGRYKEKNNNGEREYNY